MDVRLYIDGTGKEQNRLACCFIVFEDDILAENDSICLSSVSRTFYSISDFQWLRDCLDISRHGILIPPLPPKEWTGGYCASALVPLARREAFHQVGYLCVVYPIPEVCYYIAQFSPTEQRHFASSFPKSLTLYTGPRPPIGTFPATMCLAPCPTSKL